MSRDSKSIGWKWTEPDQSKRASVVKRVNAGNMGCITEDDAFDCVDYMSLTLKKRLGLVLADFGLVFQPHYKDVDRIGEVFNLAVGIHWQHGVSAPPPVTHFDLDERYALTSTSERLVEFERGGAPSDELVRAIAGKCVLACGNFSFGFRQRGGVPFFNYCAQYCSVLASTVSQRMAKEAKNNAIDRNFVLIGEHELRAVPHSAGNQPQLFQIWARVPMVRTLQARNRIFPPLALEKDNLRKLVHRVRDTVDFIFLSSKRIAAAAAAATMAVDNHHHHDEEGYSDDDDDEAMSAADEAAAAALKEAEPSRTFCYRRVGGSAGRAAKLTLLGKGVSPNSNYTIEVRQGKPLDEVLARIERAVRHAETQLASTSAVRSMSKHDLCVAYNDLLERDTQPWRFSNAVFAPPKR